MGFMGTSDGSKLQREFKNKREVGYELLQAVQVSQDDGTPVKYGFDSEAEAKGVMLKLRAHLNSDGRGLKASKPAEEDGQWVVEFKVTETKRDVSPLKDRTSTSE